MSTKRIQFRKNGRKIPSLSDLKTQSGRYIFDNSPGVKETSSLYPLMKALTSFDSSSLKEGNIIALTPLTKFIAQAPYHRYGFQKNRNTGEEWNYGVGHIFDIVGVIIGRERQLF